MDDLLNTGALSFKDDLKTRSGIGVSTGADDSKRLGMHSRASKRTERLRTSHHGITYPALPTSMIKEMFASFIRSSGFHNSNIDKDMLKIVTLASDWYFEQLGDDLKAYADHARRRTIDEADVIALMKRYEANPN